MEKIGYKVVEKGTRYGSNLVMYRRMLERGIRVNAYVEREVEYLVQTHPTLFPVYLKDTKIKKAPGSVGILVFDSRMDAEGFIIMSALSKLVEVIRVICFAPFCPRPILLRQCGARPRNLVTLCKESEFANVYDLYEEADYFTSNNCVVGVDYVEVIE